MKILVALDGSMFAESALRPAVELAQGSGVDVHLIQVVSPPRESSIGGLAMQERGQQSQLTSAPARKTSTTCSG